MLISTQVGTLVSAMILVFFYLILGTFPIDMFDSNKRNKKYDLLIYFGLLMGFVTIYAIVEVYAKI